MKISRFFLLISLSFVAPLAWGQAPEAAEEETSGIPQSYFSKVDKKISRIGGQITGKSAKYFSKFKKSDRKFRKKLKKLHEGSVIEDIEASANKFTGDTGVAITERSTARRKGKSRNKAPPAVESATEQLPLSGEYIPYLDTLSTSLTYLCKFHNLKSKAQQPLASVHNLQSKLLQTEKAQEYFDQRKTQLKQLLSSYTKVPAGLQKEYNKLSKTAYYYSAQVREYKEMLKDPKKIERKALAILREVPAFQQFMKKNSQLASLFRMPDNTDPAQSLAGLQTRASVQGLIQQRLSAGGPDAMQIVKQNVAEAMKHLDDLKDKINQLGGNGGSDVDMPDFKPNNQKTKSFLKRLEYSTDFQFAKSSTLFPSTANIGLGAGYKLNDKSLIGVGVAYKMGMGSIDHISFTHQGLGLRSYVDYKLKKTFYLSGGYEMNYNAAFKNIAQLREYSAWQRSGLIGLSKKYEISKKMKGEMKVLWDFLAREHVPVSEPLIFRFGYSLK